MYNLVIFLAISSLSSIPPAQGVPDVVPRATYVPWTDTSWARSGSLPSSWRIEVPLNFGALTNNTFSDPPNLFLQFTDPKLYAKFFAYGGGEPYEYGPLTMTSIGSSSANTYTISSATTVADEDTNPEPYLYRGQLVGSGPRSKIYGSSRFGSGLGIVEKSGRTWTWFYPPTLYNTTTAYPFGFWPIYWGYVPNHYNFSLPFKSSRFRPGGAQTLILASLHEDISETPYYYVVADEYTIKGLNTILSLPVTKGGCNMSSNSPIYGFDPEQYVTNGTRTLVPIDGSSRSRQNFLLEPESAVQYYRGSSVVLGTPGYVNEFSLNHSVNTTYWGTTPWNITTLFPSFFHTNNSENTGADMIARYRAEASFLDCLNTTIAAAVPIIDPNLTEKSSTSSHGLARGEITAIVISSLFVLIVICACWTKGGQLTLTRKRRSEQTQLGRHIGGRRVVFPGGDVLPDYSRHPAGYYNPSYPMAQSQSASVPLLPRTRDPRDTAGDDDDLPPPYSPSPSARR
ncbi:hypothetical protein CPB86DRAFT_285879 [Serendipita vermifera]|nr:hypothetical protein CPB86DRAFT_285879 [Serendipita vermifera]